MKNKIITKNKLMFYLYSKRFLKILLISYKFLSKNKGKFILLKNMSNIIETTQETINLFEK